MGRALWVADFARPRLGKTIGAHLRFTRGYPRTPALRAPLVFLGIETLRL